MHKSGIIHAAALIILTLPSAIRGQERAASREESFSMYVERKLGETGLVGAGIGVIRPDGTTWARGFGFANLEEGMPASADTVAMWASSSKIVTCAAVMKAVQHKGIGLDSAINAFLPFKVANPIFQEAPITFRMLLTHTSSILYDQATAESLYGSGDTTMPLADFLREYLVPAGRFYKATNYSSSAPGKSYAYSNINASLLGFLVERITATPFNEFCRQALFIPLGMRQAGWFLKELDVSHIAVQYRAAQSAGRPRRVPHYGWPGYPDGMLRCSTADMLRMMAALLGRGQGDAAGVLAPETLKEIFKPQGIDPDQLKGPSPLVTVDSGLVWRMIELDGRRVWSHTGNGAGMATAVLLDDKAKAAGAVWVSGGALENKDGQIFFMDLLRRLLAEMLRS